MEGEWQLVSRRKPNPTTALPKPHINLYTPFNNKPLYSQITKSLIPPIQNTTRAPIPPPANRITMASPPSPPSHPSSPPPTQATYYFSPHSPTQLRFPPSSHFTEWRGRCFRCCRTGHTSAACRNPMRCGKCWGEGHMGTRCTANTLNPAAMPYWANRAKPQPAPAPKPTPLDELLKPCPRAAQAMPSNRPKRLEYHCRRDASTLSELDKLKSGVVFNTHGNELGFSLQDVMGFATRTNKVQASEISIAKLNREKFLIILPFGLAPETFINATGSELWDAGFSFQPWSPLDGSRMVLPLFQAFIDLHDIPPHLFEEPEVMKVVQTFGTFVVSIPSKDPADLSRWSLVVAVSSLEKIPEELLMHDLGSEYIIPVTVQNWVRRPLYKASDLSRHPPKFSKPVKKPVSAQQDHFHVSRRALIQICSGIDPKDLPAEVQAILSSPVNLQVLSGDVVEQLVNCPTMSHATIPVAGQPSSSSDPKHILTATQPPQNPPSFIMADQSQEMDTEITQPTQNNTETTTQPLPQITQPQFQILRRSVSPPVTIPIPRRCNTQGEGSAIIPYFDYNGQKKRMDISHKSRVWTRPTTEGQKDNTNLTAPPSQKDKGKAVTQAVPKPTPRPKKGNPVLIPPKPVLFKKIAQQQFTGRIKQKPKQAQRAAAEVKLGQGGFYEVKVQYGHKEELAAACGLSTALVSEALREDNSQRREELPNGPAEGNMDLDSEGLDLDFDSEEELVSEEDIE